MSPLKRKRQIGSRKLGRRFETWVRDGLPVLTAAGYPPHRFQQMVDADGAVGATRRLLNSDNRIFYGLQRLYEIRRLDASVEFGALLPWFEELFTDAERYEAETRLRSLDFDVRVALAAAVLVDWTLGHRTEFLNVTPPELKSAVEAEMQWMQAIKDAGYDLTARAPTGAAEAMGLITNYRITKMRDQLRLTCPVACRIITTMLSWTPRSS